MALKTTIFLALCCFVIGSSAQERLRIVGDSVAPIGGYPYLVSLRSNGGHFCGGSLITPQHVLTAAHCVVDIVAGRVDKSRITVAVGTNTVRGGKIYGVDRITQHPSFDNVRLIADVAVIKLKSEVALSENVRVIKLPKEGLELPPKTELNVAGFGADRLKGRSSADLKELTTYSLSRTQCQIYWPAQAGSSICAYLRRGRGVCDGDSGGPVAVGKQVVVGIVSGTSKTGCGNGYPDLFTYVPKYLDFIYKEIRRH